MNAEKMIKTESKHSLSGKWVAAELSMLVLMFVPIIVSAIAMLSYAVLGESELKEVFGSEPVKGALFVVLNLVAVAALLLLSPTYNGFARLYSGIADGKEPDAAEVFWFFDSKQRYISALTFMSVLLVKCVGILAVCEAPALAVAAAAYGTAEENETLSFVAVCLAVAGLVGAFFWFHRFAFQMMLFSYYDYDPLTAAQKGAAAAKNGTGKLVMLTLSFIPWILLTLLVLPFVYVFPYMTCSYFVSAKYLIGSMLEGERAAEEARADVPAGQTGEDVPAENAVEETAENVSAAADDPEENAEEENAEEAPAENISEAADIAAAENVPDEGGKKLTLEKDGETAQ